MLETFFRRQDGVFDFVTPATVLFVVSVFFLIIGDRNQFADEVSHWSVRKYKLPSSLSVEKG